MPLKRKKKKITKRITKKKVAPKKKVVRKVRISPKKKPARKKAVVKKLKENIIGKVTHYFPKVRAAVVKLKAPMSIGDTIKIKGHTTNFTETVTSMQIDRVPINTAKKGQEIGLLVGSRVRQHDIVYKV